MFTFKRFTIFIIFLTILSPYGYSQSGNTECLNIESEDDLIEQQLASSNPDFIPNDTINTDLTFYIINRDDGTGGVTLDTIYQAFNRPTHFY